MLYLSFLLIGNTPMHKLFLDLFRVEKLGKVFYHNLFVKFLAGIGIESKIAYLREGVNANVGFCDHYKPANPASIVWGSAIPPNTVWEGHFGHPYPIG